MTDTPITATVPPSAEGVATNTLETLAGADVVSPEALAAMATGGTAPVAETAVAQTDSIVTSVVADPKLCIAAAFLVFMLLVYRKMAAFTGKALDERTSRIKLELDEARRLREEAQQVLEQYKRKQAEYLKEAETILENARRDADRMREFAETELKSSLEARMKQAIERIAQEEATAVNDVRDHVVDVALAAARNIITDHVGSMSQEELLKLALADIERKVH